MIDIENQFIVFLRVAIYTGLTVFMSTVQSLYNVPHHNADLGSAVAQW